MWNNAGLSTSILITTCSPANGMIHHTIAKIFVSTKLRDLGPKSSAAQHLLWDLTTFSLASVQMPCAGTGFLGLVYPLFPPNDLDDTPEFPQIPSICPSEHVSAIGDKDVLRLAMATPLPPVGLLETVLLSLKEGDTLSESTIRRLRRKEAERRAAAAEGRTPVSEHRRRRLKRLATRTSTPQETFELSPEKESAKPTVQVMETVNICDSERRNVSVGDIGGPTASASVRQRPSHA